MWPIVLITVTLLIVLLDMWAYYTGKEKTLSRKVLEWTKQWPLLPFVMGLAVGVLAGHFWPVA